VVLSLPRFRFEAAFRLKEALSAMGMPGAFVNGQADLSGMNGGREPLFIQDVIHKAFIAVGEKGTEAAAATAVPVAGRSAPPQDTLYVSADRPFFFWVRDVPTGAILFAGRVRDPSLR
jgi:serpin B